MDVPGTPGEGWAWPGRGGVGAERGRQTEQPARRHTVGRLVSLRAHCEWPGDGEPGLEAGGTLFGAGSLGSASAAENPLVSVSAPTATLAPAAGRAGVLPGPRPAHRGSGGTRPTPRLSPAPWTPVRAAAHMGKVRGPPAGVHTLLRPHGRSQCPAELWSLFPWR